MTTYKQIEANRRNARRSTGPTTAEGKLRSRRNAVRHGLTAETVICALEDAEDYKAFEAAVIADYDAQSAVERELVLRLGSLLWQIRRATTMETGLFEIQAKNLFEYRKSRDAQQSLIYRLFGPTYPNPGGVESDSEHRSQAAISAPKADACSPDLAQCRQAGQTPSAGEMLDYWGGAHQSDQNRPKLGASFAFSIRQPKGSNMIRQFSFNFLACSICLLIS